MSQWRKHLNLTLAALLLCPTLALAKPEIVVTMEAKKEITIVHEDGTKEVKIVPAETISPGEVIIYEVKYENRGNESANDVVIDNPVPSGTAYIPESASGQNSDLSFSIDGGKSYKKPSLLSYTITNQDGTSEKRLATPERYTNIRWKIKEIAKGENGKINYSVRVK